MKKYITTASTSLLQIAALSLMIALALGINYISAATTWKGPTALPPGNNADASLNVGTTNQVKDANLSVGHATNTASDYGLISYGRVRSTIGGFEFPDGTVQATAGGGIGGVYQQVITTSGTYTPHAGLVYAQVEVVGGGGGGGTGGWVRSGGGSGAYIRAILPSSTIGVSQNITIGSGGAVGSAGATTSFGILIRAGGGLPGTIIFGDGGAVGGAGGVPGTVPVGGLGLKGVIGGSGIHIYGGSLIDGTGGPSYYGGAGAPYGTFPGSSGGGGGGGGVGGSGIVIVTEYCSS